MKRDILIVLILLIVTIVGSFFLPATLNYGRDALSFHLAWAAEITVAFLFIATAIFSLIVALRGGGLWSVWRLSAFGLMFTSLGLLQDPFIEINGLWESPWVLNGFYYIPSIISGLLFIIGIRKLSKALDKKMLISIPLMALATILVIITSVVFIHFFPSQQTTTLRFLFTTVPSTIFVLSWLNYMKLATYLGGEIKKPFTWFAAGFGLYVFALLQVPFFEYTSWYFPYVIKGYYNIPFIVSAVVLVYSSIFLKKQIINLSLKNK